MHGIPDVNVKRSECYREIHVTGQVFTPSYEGMRLTVLSDVPNLENVVKGNLGDISKLIINRTIECNLNLTPPILKAWAIALQRELENYENIFGPILSPEKVQQKIRDAHSKKDRQ